MKNTKQYPQKLSGWEKDAQSNRVSKHLYGDDLNTKIDLWKTEMVTIE
jgi:hypothetical protein